ncbi:mitochondrial processing peptidase, beta-subunit Metallo peptidase. MEROPS family M16B [Saccharicrinis carchari]|uniref:Mitochondrial processing peptidase, beta-subunit Metallo peptidase. MEROPS family M16B n=1 Tax=Saccharicrinis carchari TaxID=1168039 RepID=A0A521E4H5_SACCC|nr:pitrilysin family protein [Saccharicrinis carchari]SMO78080.1 mitochondrial processing peptidase, beta-subunit Metallo peptidase. MEROPS family M16B [Saccharicrinis carchari]
MIEIKKYKLNNGLRLVVHQDKTTPLAAINLLYNVGAKDEDENKTGFAHLFEHLMFGGSINIPSYDMPLQNAGGDNNAWTSNDFTNYYLTLPASNLETGLWLESDRMLSLDFSQASLDVQKKVVIEEFKQRYLNQPYGDIPLLLRPLAYKTHPYRWPTIGADIKHIEDATLDEVKSFFYSHYGPNNAVLAITGNVEPEDVFEKVKKWFGSIPARDIQKRALPPEPPQTEMRQTKVVRDVPSDILQLVFHMCARTEPEYYAADLLSDILSNGTSARIYQRLVKEQKLFTDLHAYISGDVEKGLFTFAGNVADDVDICEAEKAIWKEIEIIKTTLVSDYELQKVKNKIESSMMFAEINFLNKAMNLAQFELLGQAEDLNSEVERYSAVTAQEIRNYARDIFKTHNCSKLYYLSKNKKQLTC